ncbi:hypothetical protein AB0O52_11445 [Arthrobacter sp. NPDC080073]|uniref:hypothetical protein n=1 Tax=Arthrobacter sp. NPDC080073 TaxID=3155919 RepID=UPI00343C1141
MSPQDRIARRNGTTVLIAKRPRLRVRWWVWKDRERNETPGIGLFRGQDLQAHMTPEEARTMADTLHDMADHIEAATQATPTPTQTPNERN